MKKRREFKMKINNPKSRFDYAELGKTVRKCVTEDIRKFNCDLVKKVLKNSKDLKSANRKLCVGRKDIFSLKTVEVTITKHNNKIVSIFEKIYNNLYQSIYIRVKIRGKEAFLISGKITQAKKIISVLTDEVIHVIRCLKKGRYVFAKVELELIKEAGEELVKMLDILFLKCIEKSEDWNNAVMLLFFKKGEKKKVEKLPSDQLTIRDL